MNLRFCGDLYFKDVSRYASPNPNEHHRTLQKPQKPLDVDCVLWVWPPLSPKGTVKLGVVSPRFKAREYWAMDGSIQKRPSSVPMQP